MCRRVALFIPERWTWFEQYYAAVHYSMRSGLSSVRKLNCVHSCSVDPHNPMRERYILTSDVDGNWRKLTSAFVTLSVSKLMIIRLLAMPHSHRRILLR